MRQNKCWRSNIIYRFYQRIENLFPVQINEEQEIPHHEMISNSRSKTNIALIYPVAVH